VLEPSENQLCSQLQISAKYLQMPEIISEEGSRGQSGISSLLRIFIRKYLRSKKPLYRLVQNSLSQPALVSEIPLESYIRRKLNVVFVLYISAVIWDYPKKSVIVWCTKESRIRVYLCLSANICSHHTLVRRRTM
jgi:hypothetical protein